MPGRHVRRHAVDDSLLGVDEIFQVVRARDTELPQARNVEQITRRTHEDVSIDVLPFVAQPLSRLLEDVFQLRCVDHGRRGEAATAQRGMGWPLLIMLLVT